MSRPVDHRPGSRRFRVLRGSFFKWPRGPYSSCRYHVFRPVFMWKHIPDLPPVPGDRVALRLKELDRLPRRELGGEAEVNVVGHDSACCEGEGAALAARRRPPSCDTVRLRRPHGAVDNLAPGGWRCEHAGDRRRRDLDQRLVALGPRRATLPQTGSSAPASVPIICVRVVDAHSLPVSKRPWSALLIRSGSPIPGTWSAIIRGR